MKNTSISLRLDILIFDLLMIFWLCIFILVFGTSQNVNFINYVLAGALVINMVIGYNLGLIPGLIASLIIIFGYGSYLLYSVLVLGTITEFRIEYVLWLFAMPLGTYLSGRLEREVSNLLNSLERYRIADKLILLDELTGFLNTQGFFQRLEEEVGRANRFKEMLSVLYVNVSDMSELKGVYGEDGYREIIKTIAQTITTNTRVVDIKGLIDEGTIGIILPSINLDSARIVKEKLHNLLDRIVVEVKGRKRPISIRLRIGEAEYQQGEDALILWERAKDISRYDVG
ncbi:MAG: GGDEF domain-containing protein [bacterium]|nr:GGDEF domain-containing protein [bacterium]